MKSVKAFILFVFVSKSIMGQIKLTPDSIAKTVDSSLIALELPSTYLCEDIRLDKLDTLDADFRHFLGLLPERNDYIIAMYGRGFINEELSKSPFTPRLRKWRDYMITVKPKLVESQFVFPEYFTVWSGNEESFSLESGIWFQLIPLE